MKNGVLGTDVIIATPSDGVLKYPRCGNNPGEKMAIPPDIFRNSTILSNGTSTSMFPIQKRSVASVVNSTLRTELYQNHATRSRLEMAMVRIRLWVPTCGNLYSKINMKSISLRTNRTLNAFQFVNNYVEEE